MYTPDVDQIVPDGQPARVAETEVRTPLAIVAPSPAPPVFAAAPAYMPPPPAYAPTALETPPWEPQIVAAPVQAPAPARKNRGWIVSAAIAAVGLIASGTLGYFLYTTTGQRDAARHQLASTQATLTDTQQQLAARKATDAYVHMYLVNAGRVETDYSNLFVCDTYGACRSAVQDALTDMKGFQSARAIATVPSALASADSQLGDALSAAIAADQQVITAMDLDDRAKLDAAYKNLNDALLSFSKAESAVAAALGQ
jgi:hypothetical protein